MLFICAALMCIVASFFYKMKWPWILIGFILIWVGFDQLGQSFIATLIFLLGVGLMIVEVYLPGFALVGILGTICIVTGLWQLAVVPLEILLMVGLGIAVIGITGWGFSKTGHTIIFPEALVLSAQNRTPQKEVKKATHMVNQSGIVVTPLRPVGTVLIDDVRYQALSIEGYIETGVAVTVDHTEGKQLYVRREGSL